MTRRSQHERHDAGDCYLRTREDATEFLKRVAASNGMEVEEVLTAGGPGGHLEWILRPITPPKEPAHESN